MSADPDRPETIPRWPLEWPLGWRRKSTQERVDGKFRTDKRAINASEATRRLEYQLERLGCRNMTLSTNMSLRLDGRPRSDENPSDPGAAIYFIFRGKATVLACDSYHAVADNIAALAAHLNALRAIERWGVGTIEQALAGYKALPADTAADWRAVFGFGKGSRPTLDEVDQRFKAAARERHPDAGGTDIEMAHLNRARDFARQELQG